MRHAKLNETSKEVGIQGLSQRVWERTNARWRGSVLRWYGSDKRQTSSLGLPVVVVLVIVSIYVLAIGFLPNLSMMIPTNLLRLVVFTLVPLSTVTHAAPPGFPQSGNGLWYSSPATIWSRHYLPVGNGYLGAMTPGGTREEELQLNIESMWSGGPFSDRSYNGGNKKPDEQTTMPGIMQEYRQMIFNSPNGTITDVNMLTTDAGAYGSYSGAGYLVSTLIGVTDSGVSNYSRYLDLETGIARAIWSRNGADFVRELFCSHPTQTCTQRTYTPSRRPFSQAYSLRPLSGLPTPNTTCLDSSTIRLTGLVSDPGLLYEILANVKSLDGAVSCADTSGDAIITVTNATSAWVTWVGATNYDMNAGDAAHDFSFRGPDPHSSLVTLLTAATSQPYESLLSAHQRDYKSTLNAFSLDLGQVPDITSPTDVLKAKYKVDTGDPYLEWVLFNYGRYLLASSARGGLPANLQGKWAFDVSAPWSGDYHANINVQMNYWIAEMTGLDVSEPLFDFMEKTWAPRGEYTARVLYNISRGWVTHNEMNIFGHTGMKAFGNSAEWANYPESAVWMMLHVWDHFDFTNDVKWWRRQGYPLLKSVAQFHLEKLIPDERFNDGTLVVSPCNSPEQAPVTFGCSHSQQLIWQLLNYIERGFSSSGDTDTAFLEEVRAKRTQMDKGIHIGSWGQLQEWKVDLDRPEDTHRHLSHLIGLYPGYTIANYDASLQGSNHSVEDVLNAAKTSLLHRGNGTGPDADAGWAKVWRAACWAQLGDANRFYHQLKYAVERNFAENLFSIYNPFVVEPIFQIDANFGYPAAVLNALIQAPDVPTDSSTLVITLLPALPQSWAAGSVRGARLRGGMTIDISWRAGRLTTCSMTMDSSARSRPIRLRYAETILADFVTRKGTRRSIPVSNVH